MTLEQLLVKQTKQLDEIRKRNDLFLEQVITLCSEQTKLDIDELYDNAKYLWITNCGDVIITEFIRCPDLVAKFVIIDDDKMVTSGKRKIYHNKAGYYLNIDNEKWYFHRNFDEFKTIDNIEDDAEDELDPFKRPILKGLANQGSKYNIVK